MVKVRRPYITRQSYHFGDNKNDLGIPTFLFILYLRARAFQKVIAFLFYKNAPNIYCDKCSRKRFVDNFVRGLFNGLANLNGTRPTLGNFL